MKAQYDNISVTAFIPWQGKALLVQRADSDDFLPGYWEQLGGKVDSGESHEDALIREIKEEAGIQVKPLYAYNEYEYNHSDGRLIYEIAYVCGMSEEQEIKLSAEHLSYKWVTKEDLKNLAPITDEMVNIIYKGFENIS